MPLADIPRAYILEINYPTNFKLLCGHDKKIHVVEGTCPTSGEFVLPDDGTRVFIDPCVFTTSKLFSACREYVYDTTRKREKKRTAQRINESRLLAWSKDEPKWGGEPGGTLAPLRLLL